MPAHHGVNRWELHSCARRGHVTYAPDDETLAHRLSGRTGLGEVWRCLRCGEFILGAPHGRGPADDAPMVLRGKALRQAIIVRALAVERWVRAVLHDLTAPPQPGREPSGQNASTSTTPPSRRATYSHECS